MSRIRGKHTTPEKAVRSLLHRLGYRFRLHVRIPVPLVGRAVPSTPHVGRHRNGARGATRPTRFVCPDLLLVKHRLAIFVHGCFWHRHQGCKNCTTPTRRRDWWLAKLNGNAARDQFHQRALRKLGWRTLVVWECETEKPQQLERILKRLRSAIKIPSPPRPGRGLG